MLAFVAIRVSLDIKRGECALLNARERALGIILGKGEKNVHQCTEARRARG